MKKYQGIFYLPAEQDDVWTALTDQRVLSDWTEHSSIMENTSDTEFQYKVNGERITGKNLKIEYNRRVIEQDWQIVDRKWEKPAKLHIDLSPMTLQTRLDVLVTHIPKGEDDEVYEMISKIMNKLETYFKKKTKKS